ncbi:S46 family peptidase [Aurantibacillus circumpalustris]|uniref:S46 family peptidase n=1 Tax=Aurantibacillus circumpalustris TaxID=3036359 RepID=UPI00295C391D|nr:S46 family peptidase [Aurantibacillus circumpalustris]
MKSKLVLVLMFVAYLVKADEGMWMPQLIDALNIKDMKKNGFKLTAKDIYDINKASMKDAVMIFGGGCTAEVISNKGLILTNHHCGFSSIAGLSTVEKDYLKNGFFAMNQNEEISCKGLTVTFIKRIEDVTTKVTENIGANFSEQQKDSTIQVNVKNLEAIAKKGNHYDAFIRPFYYGNEYYLFVTEVFKDVRLVGAPPESIGKFGGETDNWVWPRHNADFSMFRIYADKDNKPSEYNTENVPYKPQYSFPISLQGAEKGDFTMVYGFPGRTQEYLTSYAVELLVDQQDPVRVMLRKKRLEIMEEDMKKNDTLRLMYVNRYAGVANAYKKWSGEMLGLKKSDAINKKKKNEADFLKLLETDKVKSEKYSNLFKEFEKTYADYASLSKQYDYFTECLLGIDGIRMTGSFMSIFAELKKKQAGKENKLVDVLKKTVPAIPFKNFNKETDRKLFKAMMDIYMKDVDRTIMPNYLDSLFTAFKNNTSDLTNYIYSSSVLIDNTKAKPIFEDFEKNASIVEKDPLYILTAAIYSHYQKTVIPQMSYYDKQINQLQQEYMLGLKENVKDKKFYPDANGTLRVAFGKVSDYDGKDGIHYLHYTTMDGLVEKNKTGEEDFYVKPRLLDLYAKKDFGQYADKNGKLRTCFIGSNHTTGGNSGSPVLNAKGQLIGTNFDRNWEGTMSDIMYNGSFCRNITLDVRFTLWMVDKYAGAGYLLNEMKIIK